MKKSKVDKVLKEIRSKQQVGWQEQLRKEIGWCLGDTVWYLDSFNPDLYPRVERSSITGIRGSVCNSETTIRFDVDGYDLLLSPNEAFHTEKECMQYAIWRMKDKIKDLEDSIKKGDYDE